MSKEVEHYEEMCRVLKRQLDSVDPDDNAELYLMYKKRLAEFQQLLAKSRRQLHEDVETVDWDEDR